MTGNEIVSSDERLDEALAKERDDLQDDMTRRVFEIDRWCRDYREELIGQTIGRVYGRRREVKLIQLAEQLYDGSVYAFLVDYDASEHITPDRQLMVVAERRPFRRYPVLRFISTDFGEDEDLIEAEAA